MDSAYGKIKDVHQFEETEKETEFVVTVVNAPQPNKKGAFPFTHAYKCSGTAPDHSQDNKKAI